MGAARTVGVVTGLVALLLFLLVSRPEGQEPRLGASVELSVAGNGAFDISRQDPLPVISSRNLRVGRTESADLWVRNITNVPLDLSLTLPESQMEARTLAAGQLRVRLSRDGQILADTTIPGLLRGSLPTRLEPGENANFDFQVWVGGSDPGLYSGQSVAGRLDLRTTVSEGG